MGSQYERRAVRDLCDVQAVLGIAVTPAGRLLLQKGERKVIVRLYLLVTSAGPIRALSVVTFCGSHFFSSFTKKVNNLCSPKSHRTVTALDGTLFDSVCRTYSTWSNEWLPAMKEIDNMRLTNEHTWNAWRQNIHKREEYLSACHLETTLQSCKVANCLRSRPKEGARWGPLSGGTNVQKFEFAKI